MTAYELEVIFHVHHPVLTLKLLTDFIGGAERLARGRNPVVFHDELEVEGSLTSRPQSSRPEVSRLQRPDVGPDTTSKDIRAAGPARDPNCLWYTVKTLS